MADLPIAAIVRIAKKSGAERISSDVAIKILYKTEEYLANLTKEANKIAFYQNRQTIREEDINLAADKINLTVKRKENQPETRKLKYFISIPHTKDFTNIRNIVISAIQEIGLKPVVSEDYLKGDPLKSIEKSDIVIADISSNNPDVMLEIGYTLGLKKPLFPLINTKNSIPYNLGNLLFLVYEDEDLHYPRTQEQYKNKIKNWVTSTIGDKLRVEQ